jgi:glyoxylase-like metal-dependent hydrolase (beta-lactamase superfamily II)
MIETRDFFDKVSCTMTYVVYDTDSLDCVIVDPVMDFNSNTCATDSICVDTVLEFVDGRGLKLHYVLETHAHADHLSGAQLIKNKVPSASIAIGNQIVGVQKLFKQLYNLPENFPDDGSQFDILLEDGQVLKAGTMEIKCLHTPGHTPACASYDIGGNLFTGDALFVPDFGTGRCDFPGGNAKDLYTSVTTKLFTYPDDTKVFVGHDYPTYRVLKYCTTIGDSKKLNIRINEATSETDFVSIRERRDKELALPDIIFPSVLVNINAGHLPEPESNGKRYLKIPLNAIKE